MTDTEILEFYEKQYFHEVEAREKIHSRLQMPVTLIVAIAGAIAFLFQNTNFENLQWAAAWVMFGTFLVGSSLALALAIVWFVGAFHNNVYYFLPTPEQSASYRAELEATYSQYADREALISAAFGEFIRAKYVEYGTFNAVVNDRRSGYLHRCNGAIIATVILLACAFISFAMGDLDRSKEKKPVPVTVTKPVDVRVLQGGK